MNELIPILFVNRTGFTGSQGHIIIYFFFESADLKILNFHQIGPLASVGLVVAIFIYLFIYWRECLFHVKNYEDTAGLVISVQSLLRRTEPQGNIYKTDIFFLFIIPRQRLSHLSQLLQNCGLKEMSGFPSSSIYSVKNPRSTALKLWQN